MANITLKSLTPRQRDAWTMRYRYGWRMEKIALHMGIKQHTVSELLQRAQLRAGLPPRRRVRIIRTKPRRVFAQSLSSVFDY